MLLLWILVLVVGIAYLAHRRTAPLPALGVVAVYLLAMGAWSHAPGWLLLIFWVLIAVVAAPLLLPDLRRQYFTKPLFSWFQKVLPPMSETERDAIDAGTVWWDGELFSGRPDWDKLLAYPKAQLTEEEQAFIDGPTEELCAMVSDWQIGQAMDLPPAAWEHIKTHGFFALIIPKEYGGKGFSAYAHSQVAMKLATRSGDLASTVMVPNSLGPAVPLFIAAVFGYHLYPNLGTWMDRLKFSFGFVMLALSPCGFRPVHYCCGILDLGPFGCGTDHLFRLLLVQDPASMCIGLYRK